LVLPAWAADDPCAGFSWNVSHEHAVFSGAPISVTAGSDLASAPAVRIDGLYELKLRPQSEVSFAAPPGKRMLTDGAYAGIVRFDVTHPGVYRVSSNEAFWFDIVSHGSLVRSTDFQGSAGCSTPRKIVEFDLAPNDGLALQFSGGTSAIIRMSVTPAPAPTPAGKLRR